jgi:hypothetical protein
MLVRALAEYKVMGDDEYIYIEPFEVYYPRNFILRLDYFWRTRVVKSLAKRNIKIEWIKDLRVEYIKTKYEQKECNGNTIGMC